MCSVTFAVSLWLATASFLSYTSNDKTAAKIYPIYTEAMERAIVTEPDTETCRYLIDLALDVPATLIDLEGYLSPLAYELELPTLALSDVSIRFLTYIQEFRATLE